MHQNFCQNSRKLLKFKFTIAKQVQYVDYSFKGDISESEFKIEPVFCTVHFHLKTQSYYEYL